MFDLSKSLRDTIDPSLSKELKELVSAYILPEEVHAQILHQIKLDSYLGKTPEKTPRFIIALGQTGSGKTFLTQKILKNESNIVVIDSDKYKSYRPDNEEILKNHLKEYSALTRPDGIRHRDEMIIDTMKCKYNILFECAPCSEQGFYVDVNKIKQAGYSIEIHILAASNYTSMLSIHERYENQILSNYQCAKLTGLKRHDDAYDSVTSSILDAQTDADIKFFIYERGNSKSFEPNLIYSTESLNKDRSYATPIDIIEKIREKDSLTALETFNERYAKILTLMNERDAPQAQRDQLEIVRRRFLQKLSNDKLKVLS